MDTLRGIVERITYHNEENGYTVAKLLPDHRAAQPFGRGGEVAIVGNMANLNVGESVELTGRWTVHGEYGRQFLVESMRTILPATIAGIEKYLGSGLIKGVGPVTAKRIVKHFGLDTLEIIDHTPDRLIEVPGVGRKRVRLIQQAWAEQRAIKEVMLFLQSHGISTGLATKIYKQYGDAAIGIVQQDPYRLAADIYGIGFLTADKIARSLGIPADSVQRVAAGVAYALQNGADDGHVYLPSSELVERAAELLDVAPAQVGMGILHLWENGGIQVATDAGGAAMVPGELRLAMAHGAVDNVEPIADRSVDSGPSDIPQLVAESGQIYATGTRDEVDALLAEERALYLTPLFYSEMGVANGVHRICRAGHSALQQAFAGGFDWAATFDALARQSQFQLAPQQRAAVQAALTHRLTVLTGGPGTGKTTTVHTILQLARRAGLRVLLAAPTGRAAKRLAETTGQEAKTLHRLLEFQPAQGMAFKRNEESPLEGDLLIVDEASMLDLALTNHLLKALPPGMHLLLVGDVDQLPSVGAGNVLKDIIAAIESGGDAEEGSFAPTLSSARVIRLETIFRQAPGSYIITNAHRINQGEMPIIDNQDAKDFFLFKTEDPQRAAQLCVELVSTRIPQRFAIPPTDIQVLSPMHRGAVGVAALNSALQAALNPPADHKPQRQVGNRAFRVGDRVMQIRNNYDKDVFNGDMGTINRVDPVLQQIVVNVDGRNVPFDFLELDELTHAYAVSVHKSQGSEFPAVVIPLLTSHYMMLQRNLLYTAVTRARRLVVLVGQPRAISMAVRNQQVSALHTGLRERLLQ